MVTIRFVAASLLMFLLVSFSAIAQNSNKEKFTKAEEAFNKKDYTHSIVLSEEIVASGKPDPKVLHLQIRAFYNRFFC